MMKEKKSVKKRNAKIKKEILPGARVKHMDESFHSIFELDSGHPNSEMRGRCGFVVRLINISGSVWEGSQTWALVNFDGFEELGQVWVEDLRVI